MCLWIFMGPKGKNICPKKQKQIPKCYPTQAAKKTGEKLQLIWKEERWKEKESNEMKEWFLSKCVTRRNCYVFLRLSKHLSVEAFFLGRAQCPESTPSYIRHPALIWAFPGRNIKFHGFIWKTESHGIKYFNLHLYLWVFIFQFRGKKNEIYKTNLLPKCF